MKRVFDFLLSFFLITMLSPLLVLIGVSVVADSGFPILFRQIRVGRAFRPFLIFKFRTMRPERTPGGLLITVTGDNRVTGVGRYLRRYKLDELPQLFNVLKGDMSFVGPRPEVPKYVDLYRDGYAELLTVRPGITDWSSVKFRNEEEFLGFRGNPEEYYIRTLLPEKIKLSLEYVRNRSFRHDLSILYQTVKAVLCP